MNDRQRFEFAGSPTRCVKCGATMKVVKYHSLRRVYCPNYGKAMNDPMPWSPPGLGSYSGSGVGHEYYTWLADEPGLPAIWKPWKVGDAGPLERSAIYATIIFVGLMALMTLLAQLGG